VIKSPQVFLVTTFSGILYGLTYSIGFTVPISFAAAPYGYDALGTGLVLLSFGVGNVRRRSASSCLSRR